MRIGGRSSRRLRLVVGAAWVRMLPVPQHPQRWSRRVPAPRLLIGRWAARLLLRSAQRLSPRASRASPKRPGWRAAMLPRQRSQDSTSAMLPQPERAEDGELRHRHLQRLHRRTRATQPRRAAHLPHAQRLARRAACDGVEPHSVATSCRMRLQPLLHAHVHVRVRVRARVHAVAASVTSGCSLCHKWLQPWRRL